MQEQKLNEKGLMVDSFIYIYSECILVFLDECTFSRILEVVMEIQWPILHGSFYFATSISSDAVKFAVDPDHPPVHMMLSSQSPFLRRSVLT